MLRITLRSTAGGFSKARDSAPLLLNLKEIKRDGYPGHRACQLQLLVLPRAAQKLGCGRDVSAAVTAATRGDRS
jgi:hypothetical protein